ncbi:MAG: hypothetical protein LAO56_13485 [Acidobacteriia bacterium]|nr:hypothetical protein [Terriglobia bacterium]
MKQLAVAVTLLALCSLSFAGSPGAAKGNAEAEAKAALAQKNAALAAASPLATSTCSYTFTSGANNTYLQYCVTVNGNITQLMTPLGVEHIAVGSFGEGYGLCDLASGVAYYDYADFGDSGNWGAPTLLSQTATAVKIARSTSDGVWTLTQTITQVAGSASIKIAMALKNHTAIARGAELVRYADTDIDGIFTNNLSATSVSAFAWNFSGGGGPYGLMLQALDNTQHQGFAQDVPLGPDPCNLSAHWKSAPILTDGSIFLGHYNLVPKSGTKTVTMTYRGY